jgi:hypothetical protein
LNSTQPYSQSTSSSHRKNTTLPVSKEKPTTSYALKNTKKNKETETLKHSVITGFFSEVLEERENSP